MTTAVHQSTHSDHPCGMMYYGGCLTGKDATVVKKLRRRYIAELEEN